MCVCVCLNHTSKCFKKTISVSQTAGLDCSKNERNSNAFGGSAHSYAMRTALLRTIKNTVSLREPIGQKTKRNIYKKNGFPPNALAI